MGDVGTGSISELGFDLGAGTRDARRPAADGAANVSANGRGRRTAGPQDAGCDLRDPPHRDHFFSGAGVSGCAGVVGTAAGPSGTGAADLWTLKFWSDTAATFVSPSRNAG